MEVPGSEEDGFIREWAPYTKLLNKIPARFLYGLFSQELNFTSIDATDEYLAIGTNGGFVYWIGRKKMEIQKLKCENSQPITFVKILSTVDFMVAAGNKMGLVTVFQIPKEHPESVPESLKPKVDRKIERYSVRELHRGEITYIEWSKNGMKLFSGDKAGVIVITEIDFYMHLCKSVEIVNETYEIVQISYYQNSLLVSSVYRTIICTKKDSKWEISQVGKKERKSLCKLGSVFQFNYKNPSKVTAYCARPGLRIWKADKEGEVIQTLLFKDAISNPCGVVELLNPASRKNNQSNKEFNFGPISILKDNYLVTYNEDFLYILDPRTLTSLAVVDELRRVTSVAVNKDEIFVIEGDRSIVRLAYAPESEYMLSAENIMAKSLTNSLQYAVETVQNALDAPALILSTMLDNDSADRGECETIFAEECFELPPVKNLPFEIQASIGPLEIEPIEQSTICDSSDSIKQKALEMQKKLELYKMINEKEYDKELIYRSKRIKSKDVVKYTPKPNDEDVKEKTSGERPSILELSNGCTFGLPPDDRSPETIERDIEEKEKLLATILNLEPITIVSPSHYIPKDDILFQTQIEKSIPHRSVVDVDIVNLPSCTKKLPPSINIDSKTIHSFYVETLPQPVSIPNNWNLSSIQINSLNPVKKSVTQSPDDQIDNEWEFV